MNLVGKKFNKLTVLSEHKIRKRIYCFCLCECGNTKDIRKDSVLSGAIKSCGCINSPNIIGKKFGKLTVLENLPRSRKRCICDCGRVIDVQTSHLMDGHTQSCGCLQKEKTSTINGLSKTRLHKIWESMHARCECKKHKSYKIYKDKKICEEWHRIPYKRKQDGFLNFYNWATNNGYNDNLSLDRIDNSKGYCPENCRWTTTKEQARNTMQNVNITYQGKTQCLKAWCEELGLSYIAIHHCISRYSLTYPQAFDRYLYKVYNPHTFSWENKNG